MFNYFLLASGRPKLNCYTLFIILLGNFCLAIGTIFKLLCASTLFNSEEGQNLDIVKGRTL